MGIKAAKPLRGLRFDRLKAKEGGILAYTLEGLGEIQVYADFFVTHAHVQAKISPILEL